MYTSASATDAPVAQLDRASAFEAAGRGFESLRARQPSRCSADAPARPQALRACRAPGTSPSGRASRRAARPTPPYGRGASRGTARPVSLRRPLRKPTKRSCSGGSAAGAGPHSAGLAGRLRHPARTSALADRLVASRLGGLLRKGVLRETGHAPRATPGRPAPAALQARAVILRGLCARRRGFFVAPVSKAPPPSEGRTTAAAGGRGRQPRPPRNPKGRSGNDSRAGTTTGPNGKRTGRGRVKERRNPRSAERKSRQVKGPPPERRSNERDMIGVWPRSTCGGCAARVQ